MRARTELAQSKYKEESPYKPDMTVIRMKLHSEERIALKKLLSVTKRVNLLA